MTKCSIRLSSAVGADGASTDDRHKAGHDDKPLKPRGKIVAQHVCDPHLSNAGMT
jgi:hypothetical protein